MGRVIEHCGGNIHSVTYKILTYYNNGNAGGGNIFLRTRIQNAEFCNINRFREYAAWNISHKRHIARIGQLVVFCAVNGVVHTNVNIIRLGVEIGAGGFRDIRKGLIRTWSHGSCLAVARRLFVSLVSPLTCYNIIRLAVFGHKVQRHHCKLGWSAALQKQHIIIIGNIHNFAEVLLRLVKYCLIFLWAVGHLHNRLPRLAVFHHFRSSGLQNILGQHWRACAEIINSCHIIFLRKSVIFKPGAAQLCSPRLYIEYIILPFYSFVNGIVKNISIFFHFILIR